MDECKLILERIATAIEENNKLLVKINLLLGGD